MRWIDNWLRARSERRAVQRIEDIVGHPLEPWQAEIALIVLRGEHGLDWWRNRGNRRAVSERSRRP